MQECEKYTLNFVVFDLYIPWLLSSASINDRLNDQSLPSIDVRTRRRCMTTHPHYINIYIYLIDVSGIEEDIKTII